MSRMAEPSQSPFELGILAFTAGRFAEAAELFARAERAETGAEVLSNLGLSLARLGKYPEAIANYRKALAIRRDFFGAYFNLALALTAVDNLEEATENWRRAIELQPENRECYKHLVWGLYWMGDLTGCREAISRGLERCADDSQMRWARAWCDLVSGSWTQGLKELEFRWVNRNPSLKRFNPPQPKWNGEELRGRRIVISIEGGFGDTILFSRYAPMVTQLGGRVLLAAQATLAELMRSMRGVEEVIASGTGVAPEFDLHCPMMSLPRLLGTTVDHVPAEVPYLWADIGRSEKWRARIAAQGPGKKVGLVWAGESGKPIDDRRSIPLAKLGALGRVEGVRFYSLQKGAAARQAVSPGEGLRLTDWSAELNDWSDTASLVNNLDLIITVDTAVAHLAGAMGKPVWLMIPPVLDWRWLLERSDSPWYPTMRIFRQKRRGDWSSVVDEVARELRGL